MNIPINIQEPYASQLLNGAKTVEGRLNKGKFAAAQVGDTLRVNDQAEFEIVVKNSYATFREMLESEGVANMIPDAHTVDEALQVYYQFYTPEQEREFGVVALRLKPWGIL